MSKKPTEEELVAELSAIEDIQARIDQVAEDFDSGRNRYAPIDPWELGELLGLVWDEADTWSQSFWVYKKDITEQGYEFPFAEHLSLLKGKVSDKRYRSLEEDAKDILGGKREEDLALPKKEEKILRDAYAKERAKHQGPDRRVASISLYATSSGLEELMFEVEIGCGGEPCDPCSPYGWSAGEGFDPTDYIEVD